MNDPAQVADTVRPDGFVVWEMPEPPQFQAEHILARCNDCRWVKRGFMTCDLAARALRDHRAERHSDGSVS
jgi:hypothetical protein